MTGRPQNKWCFVPKCTNTSVSSPGKEFITVPLNPVERIKWLKASSRDMKKSPLSLKSCVYCCEDHFNLENDLENFMRFKFYREKGLATHIRLKRGVIPHRFDCQEGRNVTAGSPRPSVSEKVEKKKLVKQLLSEAHEACSCSTEFVAEEEVIIEPELEPRVKSSPNAAVQVNLKPNIRSKPIQVKPNVRDQCISPICVRFWKDSSTQMTPIKRRRLDSGSESFESTVRSPDGLDWVKTTSGTSTDTKSLNKSAQVQEAKMQDSTMLQIERRPKCYIGLNEKSYGLVTILSSNVGFSVRDLLLMFRKLTLNEPFECLGDFFGLSPSQASKVFSRNIHRLASVMLSLVYWPDQSRIKRLLPIPFRHRYNKLQSIIDCFEIKIEKPSNPTNQCATWSQYKQANTIKYLVSCTPNGFVSFISKGYGGRTTDTTLTQECGYLRHMKSGMLIMADRGFKNLASPLSQLGVSLVKPTSVLSGQKLQKNEVRAAKRIASLRIHFERVVGRIQTFQFLSPNVCLDIKLVPLLDAAVIVVAGLVNLQDPLFL